MTVSLGADFDRELTTLAGWNPDTIDPGSVTIDFLNASGGPTTVRGTVNTTVDTDALKALIAKYVTVDATPADTTT